MEGLIDLRHEKDQDGVALHHRGSNSDKAWRTVFAVIKGNELVLQDLQHKADKEPAASSSSSFAVLNNAKRLISSNSNTLQRKGRPMSMMSGTSGTLQRTPKKTNASAGAHDAASVSPTKPAVANVTRLRRSLSEGMISSNTENITVVQRQHLRERSQSFAQLNADKLQYEIDASPKPVRKFLDDTSLIPLKDSRVLWLAELTNATEAQALIQEEEENNLPRTTLYVANKALGVFLLRADTPTQAAQWHRELRKATKVTSSLLPSESSSSSSSSSVASEAPVPEIITTDPPPTVSAAETGADATYNRAEEYPPSADDSPAPILPIPGKPIANNPSASLKRGTFNVADVARRSHCIPHSFVTENFLLRLAKCKVCHKAVHDFRGCRCIHCNGMYHKDCAPKAAPNCGMADFQKALEQVSDVKSGVGTVSPQKSAPGKSYQSDTFARKMKTIGGDLFGVAISDLDLADNGLPTILVMCVHAIERRGLTSEGIYRISGIKTELERLRVHFSFGRPNLEDDSRWADINVVAGVFKAWLRELPEPLMTFELDNAFMALVKYESTTAPVNVDELKVVLDKLPDLNYRILHYLFNHLRKVADHSKDNKMLPGNIAKVFGPNIFRSRNEGSAMKNVGERVILVETMIVEHRRIFEPLV